MQETKFQESSERVLRVMQFAARFGFAVAPETVQICRQMIPAVFQIPVEQKWKQGFAKMFGKGELSGLPVAFDFMLDSELVSVFPLIEATLMIEQEPEWHPEGSVFEHQLRSAQAAMFLHDKGLVPIPRSAFVAICFVHDMGKIDHTQIIDGKISSRGHADSSLPMLALEQIGFLTEHAKLSTVADVAIRRHMDQPVDSGRAIARFVRKVQKEGGDVSVTLALMTADRMARSVDGFSEVDEKFVQFAQKALAMEVVVQESKEKPLLDGFAVMAIKGISPSKQVGEILEMLLEAQMLGQVTTVEEAETFVKSLP